MTDYSRSAQQNRAANVCFGGRPFATGGSKHKIIFYSITSSAAACSVGGTVRPSALRS